MATAVSAVVHGPDDGESRKADHAEAVSISDDENAGHDPLPRVNWKPEDEWPSTNTPFAARWRARQARHDSAEDFSRLNALLCTAMGWIFIPAYCFANS